MSSLSRPAQDSLTLRPAGSLNRPKAAFVTRLRPSQSPSQAARQLPDQSTTLWVEPSSTGDTRLRGARNRERTGGRNARARPGAARLQGAVVFPSSAWKVTHVSGRMKIILLQPPQPAAVLHRNAIIALNVVPPEGRERGRRWERGGKRAVMTVVEDEDPEAGGPAPPHRHGLARRSRDHRRRGGAFHDARAAVADRDRLCRRRHAVAHRQGARDAKRAARRLGRADRYGHRHAGRARRGADRRAAGGDRRQAARNQREAARVRWRAHFPASDRNVGRPQSERR